MDRDAGAGKKPAQPTVADSANYALVSSWRTTAEIPQALRDAFWTSAGRAVCVICREERSPFGGPTVVVYTPELAPFPAFIPALACDVCLARGVARAEIGGRTRRIASDITGVELRDSGVWSKPDVVSPRVPSAPPPKPPRRGFFGRPWGDRT
jgi:hypothetical protein